MLSHKSSVLGAALIVAGTTIGGGVLGLPLLTAYGGFFPSCVVLVLCWGFMVSTGLLFMEVFLWSPKEVNIVSMAGMTLGKAGKVAAWILYLYMFYSLTVAYASGGGSLVGELLDLPSWGGPLLFVALFAPFVWIGAWAVDRINVVLMGGLIVSFLLFFVLGAHHVQLELLTRAHWGRAVIASPVIFTSFGFQGSVPTLTNYLERDPRKTRKAILIGSLIPLVAYILWEWLILGTVPEEGLELAVARGKTAIYPFRHVLNLPWLSTLGHFFAFFTIVTSFLGVTLGFFDFFADGLRVPKNRPGKALLALLVFGPPLAFASINPALFLFALTYGGGIGTALLLGLLPLLMTWRGRYRLGYKSALPYPGGKASLTILFAFILAQLLFIF